MAKLLIGSDWTLDPTIPDDPLDTIGAWADSLAGWPEGRFFTIKADGIEKNPYSPAASLSPAQVLELVECSDDVTAEPEPEPEGDR